MAPARLLGQGFASGQGVVRTVRGFHVDAHEAIRLRVGQRPQQRRVDEAEDGDGCADAERERKHRYGREARRVAEGAKRVSKV